MLLFLLTVDTPIGLDEQLNTCLGQMSKGDMVGLEELYRLAHKGVYAYALSVLKNPDDAGDMMQETFVTAYRSIESYKDMGKPMAWLITIARNLCYGHLRRQKNLLGVEEEELEAIPATDDCYGQLEDNQLLAYCLSALTQEERQILVLHTVWGMKHREIAQVLNMNLSTVLSKYRRSLHKCKTFLSLQEEADDDEK